MTLPRVLCAVCGANAEFIVRKDYDIRRGGMSMCGRCKPSKGVWAKALSDLDAKVDPEVKIHVPRTKRVLTR